MISDHIYESAYAGLNPVKQVCDHCSRPRVVHSKFHYPAPVAEDDQVNHPKHYNSHPSGIEAIEICRDLTFDCGNAVKYVMRAPHKGSEKQDLEKAEFYLKDALYTDDCIMLAKDVNRVVKLLRTVADQESTLGRGWFFHAIADRDIATAAKHLKGLIHAHRDAG